MTRKSGPGRNRSLTRSGAEPSRFSSNSERWRTNPVPLARGRIAIESTAGCDYLPDFVQPNERRELDNYLAGLHPLWEQRYSTHRPPPAGKKQHSLLRPVYWLGNWQFACLGYYEPPKRRLHCAVAAEPFPQILQRLVVKIERETRSRFPASFVPKGWHLNTCLINFYGNRYDNGKWHDVARVGEHRDFEPGPVGSISLGERALFQFVGRGIHGKPVRTMWLEDNSLQIFGGPLWKDDVLHRVSRVENKLQRLIGPTIDGFATRRINFTFRYVPPADICTFAELPAQQRGDVAQYVATLAEHSDFFARQR